MSASNNNGQLVGSFSSNSLLNVDTNPLKFKLLPDGWVGIVETDSSHALLATALIKISNVKRSSTTGRALLDSGSELTFIIAELARKINAPPNNSYKLFNTIQRTSFSTKRTILVNIKSRVSDFCSKVECVIVDEIIDKIPNQYFSIDNWDFPKHLSMADPEFNVPSNVEPLLGASMYWKVLKPKFYT